MIDKKYNEWVEREKHSVDEWVSKGLSFRELEQYPIEIGQYTENQIHFRVHGHLDWFTADENITLQELERCIISDIPYIKSIQFIKYSYSPIII